MTDADLIQRALDPLDELFGDPRHRESYESIRDRARGAVMALGRTLEERGAQLEQALRERSPCRKCSGRGYTLAYDGSTRKQCESCNGSKMELRLVDRLDTVTALSQRQAETIETLRTDLADVEANAETYKAQLERANFENERAAETSHQYLTRALAAEQERDRLREALREIALAGMSAPMQFSEDETTRWHARRAWEFIGIAARALPTTGEKS